MDQADLAKMLADGETALLAGEWDAAFDKAGAVIAVDVNQPDAYFIQGVARMAKGQLDEATPLLQRTIELQPEHLHALFNLGLVQARQQEYRAARGSFMRVLELDPQRAEARLQLALAMEQSDDLMGAMQAYQDLMSLPASEGGKDYVTLAVEGVGRVSGKIAGMSSGDSETDGG